VIICPYDAITLENFLAYIDPIKCKLCRKCVVECPTDSILEINFPPRKDATESTEEEKTVPEPHTKAPDNITSKNGNQNQDA
jgi:ferredoxin